MLKNELPNMTESNLAQHISEKYDKASKDGKQVTRWDVYSLKIKIETNHISEDEQYWRFAVTNQEMRERGEHYILPKQVTLTPFPNMEDYNPEEVYNLQDDMSMPIRPNLSREPEWFDKPKNALEKKPYDIEKYINKKKSISLNEQVEREISKIERRNEEISKKIYYKSYEEPILNMKKIK